LAFAAVGLLAVAGYGALDRGVVRVDAGGRGLDRGQAEGQHHASGGDRSLNYVNGVHHFYYASFSSSLSSQFHQAIKSASRIWKSVCRNLSAGQFDRFDFRTKS